MKYVCELCGLVYDEEAGYPVRSIAPGTTLADLPEDFACPGCGSDKGGFYPADRKPAACNPREGEGKSWKYVKYSDHNGDSDR